MGGYERLTGKNVLLCPYRNAAALVIANMKTRGNSAAFTSIVLSEGKTRFPYQKGSFFIQPIRPAVKPPGYIYQALRAKTIGQRPS